jgi:hypothetical protein
VYCYKNYNEFYIIIKEKIPGKFSSFILIPNCFSTRQKEKGKKSTDEGNVVTTLVPRELPNPLLACIVKAMVIST